MRKHILFYALVLVAAIALVGCKNGSSDSLLSLQFTGPGLMTPNGRYALMDHVYTADDYSVTAFYSSGSKNVTKEAKITSPSSNIEIGAGNTLKFTDPDWNGFHEFLLTIEYGGKSIKATVVAYGAGEAIGGLKNPKTQFLPGEIVSSNIAGIAYLSKEGSYVSSSSSLPSSGYFIYADSEAFYITTVGEGFEYRDGIVPTILYLTYFDLSEETGKIEYMSRQVELSVSTVKPSNIVSGRITILPSYPRTGDTYDETEFKTYFKGLKVVLKDSDGNNHVMYATDEDGNAINGFEVVNVSVVTSTGAKKESGTQFESNDVVTLTMKYLNGVGSEGGFEFTKVYTVSNRR